MTTALSIVAAGIWSPAGRSAAEVARILRTGLPAVRSAPFSDGSGAPITMGVAPDLARLEGPERLTSLAVRALRSCSSELAMSAPSLSRRAAVLLALSPLELVTHADVPRVSTTLGRALELDSTPQVVVSLDKERAAADLLCSAGELLQRGEVDVAFVGGAHSDWGQARIRALAERRDLYTNEDPTAAFPGEHAAFIAVVRSGRTRGALPLATVVTAGAAEGPTEGAEAWGVASELLHALLPNGLDVRAGWLFGDMAFDPATLREHGALLTRATEYLAAPHLLDYPAQRIGALGAAAVPFGAALIGTSWRMGRVPSPSALVVARNEAGRRSIVVLRQPDDSRAE